MLWRQHHEGGSVQRILPGRKDGDGTRPVGQGEIHLGAHALTDPISLHCLHSVGPAREPIQPFEEFFGIPGDLEEPLRELPLYDLRLATPAPPSLYLLVGEDRLAYVAPVDERGLLVGKPLFVHLEEEPLIPPVILRITAGDLPLPVVGEAHLLQLIAHVRYVIIGPGGRMDAMFDSGVFRWKAERVPPHGMDDIIAAHPEVSGDDISNGIVSDMPHVDFARRIRVHLETVVLWFRGVLGHPKSPLLLPDLLPFGFNGFEIVKSRHADPRTLLEFPPIDSTGHGTLQLLPPKGARLHSRRAERKKPGSSSPKG